MPASIYIWRGRRWQQQPEWIRCTRRHRQCWTRGRRGRRSTSGIAAGRRVRLRRLDDRVYCRPSCSSRRPLRRNVAFFPGPVEAEASGYRPCLRCRPRDTASRIDLAVTRARGFLEAHLDEPVTLAVLAGEVGMSPHHLQRVFSRRSESRPGVCGRVAGRPAQGGAPRRRHRESRHLRCGIQRQQPGVRGSRRASRHDAGRVPQRRSGTANQVHDSTDHHRPSAYRGHGPRVCAVQLGRATRRWNRRLPPSTRTRSGSGSAPPGAAPSTRACERGPTRS